MAKLNKSEIEAIANKAYRALTEVAEAKRKEIMSKYSPSEMYRKITTLAERRDQAEKVYEESKEELSNILYDNFNYYGGRDSVRELQRFIIQRECKLPPTPSKNELIDEVTIAAIDRDFDTTKFIETLVSKFNNEKEKINLQLWSK